MERVGGRSGQGEKEGEPKVETEKEKGHMRG